MLEKVFIILLFNILFYAKTLGMKYVSDDIPSAQRPKSKNKFKHWFMVLEGHEKSTMVIDHAITTVLHALVCVFIYIGFGANNISFIAALLFAVNPINNQGSVWISGRGYVLSALGMTMAMSIPMIGPLLLLLATYSNAGFLAPLCLIGSKFSWFLFFMPLVWLFHWSRFKKNVAHKMKVEMYAEDKRIHPIKFVLAIKTFGFYLIHALIPIKNTFYHSYMQSMAGAGKAKAYSFKDRFLWVGLVSIISCVIYWVYVPWNIASFGLLWWCICISPFLNFFRCSQEIAERYAYLPLIGLMIFLSTILQSHPLLISAFLAMYATKLWFVLDAFQDDYYLRELSCLNSPNSWFAWHSRAVDRWHNKSYQEAVILWTMAKIISPNEFKVLLNIATALKLSRYDNEALEFLKLAQSNIPLGQEVEGNKMCEDWKKGSFTIVL